MLTENRPLFSSSSTGIRYVCVHDRAGVHVALRAAGLAEYGGCIGLLSPPGAVAYMGVGWWHALMNDVAESARQAFVHVLDCDNSPAGALMALRCGQQTAILRPQNPQYETIRALYAQEKAALLPQRPPSFNLIMPLSAISSLVGYFAHGYCQHQHPENNAPDTRQKKDCSP
ncbi:MULTISPECIES: hypothetical protein [Acetobacter]|jgi:hypothetical protein|uniref:Uncharacterized protein n=1 Tax=Acetobacter lovaniensis TaxID=104100 RepID=A0A841QGN3_9PROT|nr:hypothetical protein [Acetobacter lovaniensis]MBB6457343.1 hypothetical protein [Acetobacter lovaniensis]MCI1698392.1 hypothetical protein [Acetobacter lovaniensis]MCI1794842.1 hypothetical protein [Acetobacter lovaniensis]MCP1239733.1 hypothetical protein [Acetobacter lovaniensis]NHN81603.1 hypothetical protein [Acetobacter lovaniensis]